MKSSSYTDLKVTSLLNNVVTIKSFTLVQPSKPLKGTSMTEKHSWYKAALRRKKIAEAKRLKADRYVEMMNKRANSDATKPK